MTTIQIRVDDKMKKSAQRVFEKTGLDMSSAIKLFLQQSINRNNLPFYPTTNIDECAEIGMLQNYEITPELRKKAKKAAKKNRNEFINI